MKPLKETLANKSILTTLSKDLSTVYPKLNQKTFTKELLFKLDELELMERITRIAEVCYKHLPRKYPEAIKVLKEFCLKKENRFIYLFLPTFVSKYGQDHYELSIKALRDFTQYSSSEEGIRVYLKKDLEKTLTHMLTWTQSKNTHVRRLASEGCRPRLPWAKKIPDLIEDPKHTWLILDTLKADSEKYVQKSVANHINDISKDHPDWIVKKMKQWDRTNPNTKWIVKHGMRNLIKAGHKGALELFGYHNKPQINIENLKWNRKVSFGESANFSFDLKSTSTVDQNLSIDYCIHFQKKNGKQNAKTFKLKTVALKPKNQISLRMKYQFRDFTTRKHYSGEHQWQLLINGEAMTCYPFDVCL